VELEVDFSKGLAASQCLNNEEVFKRYMYDLTLTNSLHGMRRLTG
jgi:hypothetical protein